MIQRSTAARDAANDGYRTELGTIGVTLELRTGAPPANCAAADSGTLLVACSLPSAPLSASSGGVISKSGSAWSGTVSAPGGIAGHYRLKKSGGACVEQGTCAIAVTHNTSGSTAANGNTLTFPSTPAGVAVGMTITGTGVPPRATVVAISGGTVTMNSTSTTGVASSAAITFGGDMNIDNTNLATGQTLTISAYQQTAGDA